MYLLNTLCVPDIESNAETYKKELGSVGKIQATQWEALKFSKGKKNLSYYWVSLVPRWPNYSFSSVKHKLLSRLYKKCIILPSELKSKFISAVNFNIKREHFAYRNKKVIRLLNKQLSIMALLDSIWSNSILWGSKNSNIPFKSQRFYPAAWMKPNPLSNSCWKIPQNICLCPVISGYWQWKKLKIYVHV